MKYPVIGLCRPLSSADRPKTRDVEAWLSLRSLARARK